MHCDACTALVRMEIEESGLGKNITQIVVDTEEQRGAVGLHGVSEEQVRQLQKKIDALGQYEAIIVSKQT